MSKPDNLHLAINKNAPVLALLDVDETLIIGECTVDSDIDGIPEIKKKLVQPGVLNQEMLSALRTSNIKDVYLFTDMTLKRIVILERLALIEVLKEQGFTVHGAITTADPAWNLPRDTLQSLVANTALLQEVNQFIKEGQPHLAKNSLMRNEDYKRLVSGSLPLAAPEPRQLGLAFADAVDALNTQQELIPQTTASQQAKFFVDLQAKLRGMSSPKGIMFEHFLRHKPANYKTCIVFDDRRDVLQSIRQANNASVHMDTVMVYVNNNTKKTVPGEQRKHCGIYVKNINATAALTNICEQYLAYLDKVIAQEAQKPNASERTSYILALKKREALVELNHTLSNANKDEVLLKNFHEKFLQHSKLIATSRDTWAMTLLKLVATLFSGGLAIKFGIWNVEGAKVTSSIEELVCASGTRCDNLAPCPIK